MFNKRLVDLVQGLRPQKKVALYNKGTVSELYLYDVIGSAFNGITAQSVIEQLKQAKGNSLDVHILSEGGDVFEAKGIHNALVNFKGKKRCLIDGLAASAATFVMMAGDEILAAPGSSYMTHGVWTATAGGASDLRAMADQLEMETKNIAEIYSRRTKKSPEEMMQWMAEERWFDNKAAIEMGFIDGEYEQLKNIAEKPRLAEPPSQYELMNMRMRSKQHTHPRRGVD